jgi:hypothetical protein
MAMTDVTRILSAIEQGDPHAAEQLLPLVYEELRKLAAAKMAQEAPGQTARHWSMARPRWRMGFAVVTAEGHGRQTDGAIA